MSLKHILLGMLKEPDSGYNLVKRFEGSLNHFWSAKLSQIYPTLHAMEEQGWVDSSVQAPQKGPERKVYRRTRKGQKELRGWLASDPILHAPRYTFLAQTFFLSDLEDPAASRHFFEHFRETCREKLAALRQIEERVGADSSKRVEALPDDDFYRYLTLRHGIMTLSFNLQWSEECLASIDKRLFSRFRMSRRKTQSPQLAAFNKSRKT